MTKRSTLVWIAGFTSLILVPTLCLLWFMEQAVTSERHSVQKQLQSFYGNRIEQFDWSLDQFLTHPSDSFDLNQFCSSAVELPMAGTIIWENDSLIYPINYQSEHVQLSNNSLWRLEYKEKQFIQAAEQYQKVADSLTNQSAKIAALLGSARCYKKAGDNTKAIALYESLLESYEDSTEQVNNAIIALSKLYVVQNDQNADRKLKSLLSRVNFRISSDRRTFMLNQGISIAKQLPQNDTLLNFMSKVLQFEKLSNSYKDLISDSLITESNNTLQPFDTLYYTNEKDSSRQIIRLFTQLELNRLIKNLSKRFNDSGITLCLVDNTGEIIAGESIERDKPFYILPLKESGYGEMNLRFYLNDSALFSNHIKNQTARYVWIGILTILFIIITVSTATYLYFHHSNLNKLKNNFLATVTHELKTPIASCRILIETLLDEKVTDPSKVKEYHSLIAQENQRLSRLVDNFLTFSRMERNKYLQNQHLCNISEITSIAIDSMSVKFNAPNCRFSYIDKTDDCEINVNCDAIVTVVTNLLDNAYKYTESEKEIELITETAETHLNISVKDNGIGIPRREIPKLFKKFYQINQKLNRRSEGCGLGLSIVQYIVDAHGGTITVDSRENEGSIFTVKLPL